MALTRRSSRSNDPYADRSRDNDGRELLLRGDGAVTPLQMRTTRFLGGAILILPLVLAAAGLLQLGEQRRRSRSSIRPGP